MVRIYTEKSYWFNFDSKHNTDLKRRRRKREKLQIIVDELKLKADKMDLEIDTLIFKEKSLENTGYDIVGFQLDKDCFKRSRISKVNRLAFKTQKSRDLCHISEKKFFVLKKIMGFDTETMSADNKCRKIKYLLNTIFPIANNENGFYLMDPIKKIKMAIKDYIKNIPDQLEKECIDKIRIKLQSDGTNLTSTNLKHLNYTFAILNDKNHAMSPKGNFILGMYKIIKEDHETLKKSLSELQTILKDLKKIEVDNKTYEIEQFNAGDYKELGLIYGINAANSNQPCVHCDWYKKKRIDLNEKYTQRTLADAYRQYQNNQNGYIKEPLTHIEFDHAIPCMLHCKTRFVFLSGVI
jgi:hypothetical protein